MTSNSPVLVDLFAGCGGLSLGFHRAGYTVAVAVEADPAAADTYARNFPQIALLRQPAEDLSPETILNAAGIQDRRRLVVVGGPPCQGFSSLRWGRKKDKDPRDDLVAVFVELVLTLDPIAFLFENVPRIMKHDVFVDALKTLGDRFNLAGPKVLDAADYGVPQRRRRLFLAGYKPPAHFSFPPPTHLDGNRETVWAHIGDLPSPPSWDEVEDTTAGPYPNHQKSRHKPIAVERLEALKPGQGHLDLPPRLKLDCHLRATEKYGGKVYEGVYGRMRPDEPAPTLTSGCICITRGPFGHPYEPRAITPREAARLQTFPDDFVFCGFRMEVAGQIGNAVPVRLAEALARSFTLD